MSWKLIPASELREGYSLVLHDGSSRVIAHPPKVVIQVVLENGNTTYFLPDQMVQVVSENGEF